MNEYLYHYTSIETLALILKNRTIRFNNLLNVDDPDEAETSDLGKAGKYCLVSCWTDNKEDVIPMWNMYTSDMRGVRIKMRKNPFKQYTYKKGELHFTKTVKSYIDYYSEYACDFSIAPSCPILEKIEYTEDETLLKPEVIFKKEGKTGVFLGDLGRCKRKYWEFQQEYRYIIRTAAWGTKEWESVQTPEDNIKLYNRILDRNNNCYCNEIFLVLEEDAFEDMEILLAPKTSEQEKIIVEALLDKFCPNINVKLEKSKIRVK